jgi:fructose-1-phosphate kinase PfkB-like protein
MIVTVTPNPAIDKIYWIERLCLEDGEMPVMRATRSYLTAGGKGINVSIFLARLNIETIAMGVHRWGDGARPGAPRAR